MARKEAAERAERASNPFGWLVLGFICGVVATLGVLIALSGEFDHGADDGRDGDRGDAAFSEEDQAGAARDGRPPRLIRAAPAPPEIEAPAPTEAQPGFPADAPAPDRPPAGAGPPPSIPLLDPQIAEDAAASGMTARSPRD